MFNHILIIALNDECDWIIPFAWLKYFWLTQWFQNRQFYFHINVKTINMIELVYLIGLSFSNQSVIKNVHRK